jgi:hypothetical protein
MNKMIRLISILTLTLISKTILFSQVFEPILDSTKQWNVLWYYSFSGYGTESYTLKHDTMINGFKYYKLYFKNDSSQNFTYLNNKILREDSTGKVFVADFHNQNLQDEYLLYNINAQVGDTFDVRNECLGPQIYGATLRVMNIDTIWIAGKNRRRIELEHSQFVYPDNGNEFWYEGIGSSLGVVHPGAQGFDWYTSLLCFTEDNQTTLFSTLFSNCWINVHTNNLMIDPLLNIFPNPANGVLYIDIGEKANLEILNIQGQIVYSKSLTEKVNNLDISNLRSGVYTLRIKTGRGIAIRKLIKQ